MMFDFDKIFNSNKDEELLNTKLIENSPCKGCEESKFFVNNPYYISEKCNNCKEHEQWILKCLQKLSLLEDKVSDGEWKLLNTSFGFECSVCKTYSRFKSIYCPYCGTKLMHIEE